MENSVELDGMFRDLRFSACHFIPEHDKCSRLHGHDYFLQIRVYGRKSSDGMVMDFSKLKEYAREIISMLDHRVLLPTKNSSIKIDQREKEIEVWQGEKHYLFPASDCVLCNVEHTTAEALAEYICYLLADKLKDRENVERICCGVGEGLGQVAWFERRLNACG